MGAIWNLPLLKCGHYHQVSSHDLCLRSQKPKPPVKQSLVKLAATIQFSLYKNSDSRKWLGNITHRAHMATWKNLLNAVLRRYVWGAQSTNSQSNRLRRIGEEHQETTRTESSCHNTANAFIFHDCDSRDPQEGIWMTWPMGWRAGIPQHWKLLCVPQKCITASPQHTLGHYLYSVIPKALCTR